VGKDLSRAASLPGPLPGFEPPPWWYLEYLGQYKKIMDAALYEENQRVVDEIARKISDNTAPVAGPAEEPGRTEAEAAVPDAEAAGPVSDTCQYCGRRIVKVRGLYCWEDDYGQMSCPFWRSVGGQHKPR